MVNQQFVTIFIILIFTAKCDDPIECSNDIILEEACAKLKAEDEGKFCYYDGSQCLSAYTTCSFYTRTNEEECSNINLQDFRYKCTLENNVCVKKIKLCSDYIEGKGKKFCESLSGGSDNKRCVYKSGGICDTDFNECKDANEDKCPDNIPSDNTYKCIFQNNECKSEKRKCSEYLSYENCWDLEAEEQGKSCLYKYDCIEDYKYCEDYTGEIIEDICEKIKPYIKGTNEIDYSHKCFKKNNKCVAIQRECEDYDSNTESSYYCTQLNFEGNPNKKCFLDGNNCELIYLDCDGYTGGDKNECESIIPRNNYGDKKLYIKCKFENSKCLNRTRECEEYEEVFDIFENRNNFGEIGKELFCYVLSPSDKNNTCMYKSPNICLELPEKCEEYVGNSKEECELIYNFNSSFKCIYENNNCKMKQRENCSDLKYPVDQYMCNDIVLSETKRCFYYDNKCQEFYKNCEDYKGKDRLICESIQPYKSMLEIDEDYECIFEKDGICTKKKKEKSEYCNYYGSNDELCTLQTPSDPSTKVCARKGYECFEQYKYCSEYKGLVSEECESIDPYDPETNKKDLYSRCKFINQKCVKTSKKCSEYSGYDSKICSKYSAEDENKVCALKGNTCTEQYKTCESYTENDPDICNSIILNDFTKKCEFKASSGDQPAKCVTRDRTCSELDFGYTANYCENHLLNNYKKKCSYRYGYCDEYINSCDEIIFENVNEAAEEKCNAIEVSTNYICTLKSDKSGCRRLSKDDYEEQKKLEEEKHYNGYQNIISKKYIIIIWSTIYLLLLF